MDDLAESLWAAFAAESDEHLTVAEPLIASAESEPPTPDTIAQLFRDFHSLKGLARGLGMKSMEAVAHNAESLLGLVRSGQMALGGAAVGTLLEAVDALRALRRLAVEERRDGDLPEELVARLAALAAAAETAPAPETSSPAAVQAARLCCVDADPDMCQYFAELLRDDLGELGHRLVAPVLSEPANQQRLHELLSELDHAATSMELNALATLFRALAEALQPGMEWTRFHLLTRVEDLVTTFEAETGLDAGAATFRADLQDMMRGYAVLGRQRLLDALDVAVSEPTMLGVPADFYEAVAVSAGDLGHALSTQPDATSSARAAFLIQDIFARCRLGEFVPTAATLAAAVDLAKGFADAAAAVLAELQGRFIAAALSDMGGGGEGNSGEFVRAFLRKQHVGDDLLSSLSPEAVGEAGGLISRGWDRAYVVEAQLEASPETADRFLKWLEADVHVLTNRAFTREGQTWYRFLLLGRGTSDSVRERLSEIDPGGRRLIRLVDPAATEARPSSAVAAAAAAIRVPSEVIDRFMAHIGELLLARSTIHLTLAEGGFDAAAARLRKLADSLRGDQAEEMLRTLDHIEETWAQLSRGDQHLHGVLKRLQESALELRVVPIDTVFSRFPRVVRDIAQRTGKTVRLDLAGRDVRIDKGMVDQLVDPLTHMVRNAIDHGIELPQEREAAGKPATGLIRLSASQRGNRVIVEISDDGRGLDRARILAKAEAQGLVSVEAAQGMSDEEVFALIFLPGFSTTEVVTEMSGRGVGMDVVNVNIGRLGGRVAITSRPGSGTTFTLSLPLSAAIQDVLLVEAGGQTFAIPERFLLEICEVEQASLQTVRGQRAMLLRQAYLPVFELADLLGLPPSPQSRAGTVLIIGSGAGRMGVEVDRVARRQELYVKDIHARLLAIPGVGGASVLGDGRVVIILDVEALFRLAAGGHLQTAAAMAAE
ncbi:MAG: chemotaxis protein CheW [Solirubrobacterales bacterium]